MSISSELKELKAEFDELQDSFSQYAYLVELSQLLPPPEESLRQGLYAYHSCQSQVWIRLSVENNYVHFDADSDTLIIRGVLALFRELLEGKTVEEVLQADFELLKDLGIQEHFSSQRISGIGGLLPEIKRRLSDELSG